jgi:hypothetical protein
MNLDDPKLTAFALDELDEPERAIIARAVAESLEAQRYIEETRQLAVALKKELEAHLTKEVVTSRSGGFQAADQRKRRTGDRRSLIDIRNEPWFWARVRPLAMAAAVAILAVVGAVILGIHRSQQDFKAASSTSVEATNVEGEYDREAASDFNGPASIPNPWRGGVTKRIERVVIGELDADPSLQNGEMRVIEMINDFYRLQRLRHRLEVPALSKKVHRNVAVRAYKLIFLDENGHVIASAAFYRAGDSGFVLQPSKYGSEKNGHYFPNRGDVVLPGDWQIGVDYLGYAIPFPDWSECIGYSPGA